MPVNLPTEGFCPPISPRRLLVFFLFCHPTLRGVVGRFLLSSIARARSAPSLSIRKKTCLVDNTLKLQ